MAYSKESTPIVGYISLWQVESDNPKSPAVNGTISISVEELAKLSSTKNFKGEEVIELRVSVWTNDRKEGGKKSPDFTGKLQENTREKVAEPTVPASKFTKSVNKFS